jgi:DNA-binding MarR family transcriptional regulator
MPHQAANSIPSATRLSSKIKQCEQILMAEKQRVLRPLALSTPQYRALLALSETPRISGTQLARCCGVTAQAMNGLVALLEERGLISRTRSDVHAKVRIIELTRRGKALLRRADQAAIEVERRLIDALPPEQLDSLHEFLGTVIDSLSRQRAPVRST